MKSIFLPGLALLLSLTSTTLAQENQKPVQPLGDDSEFLALHNPVISADGAWMAVEERPGGGDRNVRVWSTEGDKAFTIERGQNPRISRDSRWVSALQKPPFEDSKTAKPKNNRAGQTLVLLDTQDGSSRTFEHVLSYEVIDSSTWLVYLQSQEVKADEVEPSNKVGTLHLVHLESDSAVTVANVTEYAAQQTTSHVAYVFHDEEAGHDRLHIAGLHWRGSSGVRGFYSGDKIQGLRWARDVTTLGFLDSTETLGKDGKRRVNSELYTWHVTGPSVAGKVTRVRDDSEFRALHNPVISADGAWMAAEVRPDQGDGNVRVWSTEGDVTFTIERGQNPRISRDSRWVSALQKPPLEETKTDEPTNQRAGQTLVLLDTQDGSRRTFDFVLSHDWTYSHDGTYTSMHLVYLQSPETKADEEGPSKDEATKPAAKERKVGTLHLVHLQGDGDDRVWQNVTQYAAHQTTRRVAFVLHDEETGRDTLHIAGFSARNWGTNGIYDGEKIEGLCWARDRLTLGFLDSTETTGKDGKRRVNSALYMWQLEQREPGQKLDWGRGFTRVDTPQ